MWCANTGQVSRAILDAFDTFDFFPLAPTGLLMVVLVHTVSIDRPQTRCSSFNTGHHAGEHCEEYRECLDFGSFKLCGVLQCFSIMTRIAAPSIAAAVLPDFHMPHCQWHLVLPTSDPFVLVEAHHVRRAILDQLIVTVARRFRAISTRLDVAGGSLRS